MWHVPSAGFARAILLWGEAGRKERAARLALFRSSEGGRSPPPRSLPDDVTLHRSECADQLLLLLGADLVLVEGLAEVLDRRAPLGLGDLHALVGGLHVAADVGARAAGGIADLIGEVGFQLLDIVRLHVLEPGADARISGHVAD